MNIETLAKEVLNSNLSDDAKVEIMKAIFGSKEKAWVPPYNIGKDFELIPNQPIRIPDSTPCKDDWWRKVTTIAADGDLQWWRQHMENAKADCVGVLGSQITYS